MTRESSGNRTDLTPCRVDARLRESPLSLAELRRMIPPRLRTLDVGASWRALLRALAMVGISLGLLSILEPEGGVSLLWQGPMIVTVWILYGWVLVGLFALGHDCGHGTFSNRKWVNTVIGHLCMSPLGNPLMAWQVTHDHHHRYTQLRGQDVDWSANLRTRAEIQTPSEGDAPLFPNAPLVWLGYRIPCGIAVWIIWNTLRRGAGCRSMLTSEEWQTWRRSLWWSSLLTYGTLVLIYGGLWMSVGFWDTLKYFGVPATIAMLTGSFIITIHHASPQSLIYSASGWDPARSQMASTFDVRFPRWVEYLWCDINIHIPHHVAPEIPWYHLQESARILSAALPWGYLESRFSLKHLKFFWRTPFLKSVQGKGYFILDSSGSPWHKSQGPRGGVFGLQARSEERNDVFSS